MNINTRVCALYDFCAEPNTREINLKVGEILTVTQTDIGNGWWKGTNSLGETGLFPEKYVKLYNETFVATPIAADDALQNKNNFLTKCQNIFKNVKLRCNTTTKQDKEPLQMPNDLVDYSNDTDDEYWEDDIYEELNYDNSHIRKSIQSQRISFDRIPMTPIFSPNIATSAKKFNFNEPLQQPFDRRTSMISIPSPNISTTAKKFDFAYHLYADDNVSAPKHEFEHIFIIENDFRYYWKPHCNEYTVVVASPTKFKDTKNFAAAVYQLTPSHTNISVSRQYKHFDWLYERLVELFSLIPIPTLPVAKLTHCRHNDEEFLEQYRLQLQEFINWICRHPVLSKCEVFHNFLTSTDEVFQSKIDTTSIAEQQQQQHHPLGGSSYFAAIYHPSDEQLQQTQVDCEVDKCEQFISEFTCAVKSLLNILNEQIKHYSSKNYFQKIGDGFSKLTRALDYDECRITTNVKLAQSMSEAGDAFFTIAGKQFDGAYPKYNWIPLINKLYLYRGILAAYPNVFATYRDCVKLKKECEKLVAAQKISDAEMKEINRRTDIMSYAVLAEVNYFRAERDLNLREVMKNLIVSQMDFYRNVVVKLQATQELFE